MNDSTSREAERKPQDAKEHPDKPGAEKNGSTGGGDALTPFSPDSDEESPLGDTDEHSDA